MPELFSYLLKVNAALVLFCLAYYLVLRKLTFYNLNRIFLLLGIVFSTLYPLVNLSLLFKEPERLVIPLSTVLPVMMATEVNVYTHANRYIPCQAFKRQFKYFFFLEVYLP